MTVPLLVLALVVGPVLPHPTTKVSYYGHKVFEIPIRERNVLTHIMTNLHDNYDLDVWKMPHHVNDTMYVRVSKERIEAFLSEMKQIQADINVWVEDVQSLIDESYEDTAGRQKRSHPNNHGNNGRQQQYDSRMRQPYYRSLDEIENYLKNTVPRSNHASGASASVHEIGFSSEGRPILLIEISTNPHANKPVIFIDGGIHAREWIAPATVLCFIEMLVDNADKNTDVDELLRTFDFHIVPVVNPDGYHYSITNERMWRKNRNPNGGSICTGVDLNRNFPFHWDPATGGSTNPCSDLYSGPAAGSESETRAITQWLQMYSSNIKAYLTFHSYGQYWLYPWGYTSDLPTDYLDLDEVARISTRAIWEKYFTGYIVGSATNVLYAAAGGSDDYAKGGCGVKYSYTIELRDTGRYGFVLPASQIEDTCMETWAGVAALLNTIRTKEHL